jgi:hypothetical protein
MALCLDNVSKDLIKILVPGQASRSSPTCLLKSLLLPQAYLNTWQPTTSSTMLVLSQWFLHPGSFRFPEVALCAATQNIIGVPR